MKKKYSITEHIIYFGITIISASAIGAILGILIYILTK